MKRLSLRLRRREFMGLLGGATVGWPLAARALQPKRMRGLGVLSVLAESDPEWQPRMTALLARLQSFGWQPGRDLQVEYRYAVGDAARIQTVVKEMVLLAPDVIMTMTNPLLAFAVAGNPHHSDCVRAGDRSSRQWLR